MDKLITTELEASILEKFKDKLSDLNEPEVTLARFLAAREFNMEKAEDMLRRNLIWRKEYNLESILKEFNEEDCEMKREFPYEINGFDFEGGPILWIPLGEWDARTWLDNGGNNDNLLRWIIRIMEDALTMGMNAPHEPRQGTLIFDLEHLTYTKASHIPSLKVLFKVFQTLERNYPETLKSIVVVNVPWIYTIPYNFIKCILSTHTISKAKFFDCNRSSWINYFTELGPQKSLPKKYTSQDEE